MNLLKTLSNNTSSCFDVSVVIPTFNRVQYLYPTLLCLLNQKSDNVTYEIVIVDSGKDETGALIKELSRSNPGRLVWKQIKRNCNRSLLRNIGAKLASGKVLVFLDNDMMVSQDFIKTHYDKHQNKENLVLLGKRKSLTEFAPEKIGYEYLIKQFNILEEMPYYRDVRDPMLDDICLQIETVSEPWRFLYSHNFSIRKSFFLRIGGFNIKFGEHWGYEDIELGFRCHLHKARFEMERTLSVYHQTHFEQSRTEQSFAIYNRNLFTQTYHCFETELYAVLYHHFQDLYPIMMKISENVFSKINLNKYRKCALVFGCLFTSKNLSPSKKFFLGTDVSGYDSNAVKEVVILETFWSFPYEVKLLIGMEALRIANKAIIINICGNDPNTVRKLCSIAGYEVNINIKDNNLEIVRERKTKSLIYVITIPDIFSPVRRFCYLLLVRAIHKSGLDIHISDIKETKDCDKEDFLLPDDDRALLNQLFGKGYGGRDQRVIHSESILYLLDLKIPNDPHFTIIHDMEYPTRLGDRLFSEYGNCGHIPISFLEKQIITSLYEYIKKHADVLIEIQPGINQWCCFMESGYLEDGMDIILQAFDSFHKKNMAACLKIKVPDFNTLYLKNSSLNNDSSKFGKSYGMLYKLDNDLRLLMKKIEELSLLNSVVIIRENMSMYQIFELIQGCAGVVCASRSVSLSVEVYMALLLKKKVIVPERCCLDKRFDDYVFKVSSQLKPFAQEFSVPTNSSNLAFLASCISAEELYGKWLMMNSKNLLWDVFDNIISDIIQEYYNDFCSFFGNLHGSHGPV